MIRPLYKAHEPFMEAPAAYGFLGVIMYDDKEDKVQCHVCGGWYRHVGSHAHVTHKISGEDYKDRFGLTRKIALCSMAVSKKRAAVMNNLRSSGRMPPCKRMSKSFYKRRKYRNGQATVSFKNRNGLCDLQMFTRYEVVKNIVGREPTCNDLRKYDSSLMGVIGNRGTLNEYKESIGKPTRARARPSIPDIELVAQLRKWAKENNNRPRSCDFLIKKNGYASRTVFQEHFGSWNNALRIAGIK